MILGTTFAIYNIITLSASSVANFSSFTNLGTHSLSSWNDPAFGASYSDIISFKPLNARYVRLEMIPTNNSNPGISIFTLGEIAFSTDAAVVSVHEPSTLYLLFLGIAFLSCIVINRRQKNNSFSFDVN